MRGDAGDGGHEGGGSAGAAAVAGQGNVSRACANGKLKTESACTHNFNIPQLSLPFLPLVPPPTKLAPPAVSRADSPGVVLRTPLCCCDSIPHVVVSHSLSRLWIPFPACLDALRWSPSEKEMKKGEPETASISNGQASATPLSLPSLPAFILVSASTSGLACPVLILCQFRSVALQNF